ncbi:MAG: LCP family protein [Bifidobacteriaceae bacterium]|nr:LCP family protein [Bifidobacteriaceae bacterium]
MAVNSRSDDFSTPPSFVPSPRQRAKNDAQDALPPSFTPSGGNGATGQKPEMIPAAEQTPVHGYHPLLPKEPRRSGSSPIPQQAQQLYEQQRAQYESLNQQKQQFQRGQQTRESEPTYQSYAPQRQPVAKPQSFRPASQKPKRRHAAVPSSNPSTRQSTASTNAASANNASALPQCPSVYSSRTSHARTGAAAAAARPLRHTRHKHYILRILAISLAVILVALGASAYGTYAWVDHNIQHYQALTSRPKNDNAETWLITGIDARDGAAGTGAKGSVPGFRTDSIMLLIKPKKGPDALISIPRDTLVVVNGQHMKINAVAETDGWPALANEVELLTGVKVDHAVRANFNTIEDIVNALGGVYVCFDHTVNDPYSGFKWTAGCGVMQGEQALAFTRERHSDRLGDIGREHQQRLLIQDIVAEMEKPSFYLNPTKIHKVILAGLQNVKIDDRSHASTLLTMAMVFRDATSKGGITGIPYISDMGYQDPDIGSCILWNATQTKQMFQKILNGTESAGTVGGIE